MAYNPFNDPAGCYRVLVNDRGEHSLWPGFAAVPAGWSTVLVDADRDACTAYLARHRPAPAAPAPTATTTRVKSNV
ncbi:MbtH family protein [Kitasatospora sp. NPDC093550]|uniref:MbtH family protein n=1 Tax=Kitasatospora sp. NPDC093550 TaxID=3364089 RepID=UPI00381D7B8A